MSAFDNWLLNQAEAHTKDCTPSVTSVHHEYEGHNEPPSQSFEYNCQDCDQHECEYWAKYNENMHELENNERENWDAFAEQQNEILWA